MQVTKGIKAKRVKFKKMDGRAPHIFFVCLRIEPSSTYIPTSISSAHVFLVKLERNPRQFTRISRPLQLYVLHTHTQTSVPCDALSGTIAEPMRISPDAKETIILLMHSISLCKCPLP